jgi:hypothetical protein
LVSESSSIAYGWKCLGAASSESNYQVFFENTLASYKYARWNVNSTGYLQSSDEMSFSQILEVERTLNFDLLGDGRIGVMFTGTPRTLEDVTFSATNTLPNPLYGIKVGNAPIAFPKDPNGNLLRVDYYGQPWTCVAASRYYPGMGRIRDGFALYWTYQGSTFMWLLDDSFAFKSSFSASVNAYETHFQFDWNGNGAIGY